MKLWWSLGKIGGVPVRIHAAALLGAIFFSGFRFAPGAWLGFLLVILAHELGHAALVKAAKQHVMRVDVHAFGGECHWVGDATPLQRAVIAWGGVLGQLAVGIVAAAVWIIVGHVGSFWADLLGALTTGSLWIAALNLVPIPPFDGAEAWKLVTILRRRWSLRRAQNRTRFSAQARVVEAGKRTTSASRPAKSAASGGKNDDELRKLLMGVSRDAREARKPHN